METYWTLNGIIGHIWDVAKKCQSPMGILWVYNGNIIGCITNNMILQQIPNIDSG
jgi:hypothetical protein